MLPIELLGTTGTNAPLRHRDGDSRFLIVLMPLRPFGGVLRILKGISLLNGTFGSGLVPAVNTITPTIPGRVSGIIRGGLEVTCGVRPTSPQRSAFAVCQPGAQDSRAPA